MSPQRRSLIVGAAPAFASAALPAAAFGSVKAGAVSDAELDAIVARATQAHVALMLGDVERYRASIALSDDFTLMPPFGGPVSRSSRLSAERWAAIGRFFKNGRNSTLELVQAHRSADMVVLAAVERTHVEVGGLDGQDWALRVTLVFRREKDEWRLVHRHADPLVEGISHEEAAAIARRRAAS